MNILVPGNLDRSTPLPDTELLRELLSYCPDSGKLHWKVDRGKNRAAKAGDEAGTKADGRVRIRISGYGMLQASRVAWAIHHGKWPTLELDHEDKDPSNNRIKNLREISHSGNAKNTDYVRTGVSNTGMAGITKTPRGTYAVKLSFTNGRWHGRKRFKSLKEAVEAREQAERLFLGHSE